MPLSLSPISVNSCFIPFSSLFDEANSVAKLSNLNFLLLLAIIIVVVFRPSVQKFKDVLVEKSVRPEPAGAGCKYRWKFSTCTQSYILEVRYSASTLVNVLRTTELLGRRRVRKAAASNAGRPTGNLVLTVLKSTMFLVALPLLGKCGANSADIQQLRSIH
jgi:hypothetical protein